MNESKGRRLLLEALKERGAQQALARKLERPASLVSVWRSGRQKPSTSWRVLLLELLGIPLDAWDQPSKDEGAS